MDEIKDLFFNKKSKLLQFKVIVIILIVIVFFIYYFNKTYPYIIILLLFAIYIANSYVKVHDTNTTEFNTQTMIKLKGLQNKMYAFIDSQVQLMNKEHPKSITSNSEIKKMYNKSKLDNLYIDANIIHFLDSIIILYNYNPNEFYLLLKGIDNILKIRNDIEYFYTENNYFPKNIPELLENAIYLKTLTLNNLHNFIYTVPTTNIMYDYTNRVVNRYHILITRNIDIIYNNYLQFNKTVPINTSTKFISYDVTKPFDIYLNHSINVSKDSSKLIPFWL